MIQIPIVIGAYHCAVYDRHPASLRMHILAGSTGRPAMSGRGYRKSPSFLIPIHVKAGSCNSDATMESKKSMQSIKSLLLEEKVVRKANRMRCLQCTERLVCSEKRSFSTSSVACGDSFPSRGSLLRALNFAGWRRNKLLLTLCKV